MDSIPNEFELPSVTPEQRGRIAQLSEAQRQAIDVALLSNVTTHWRKVARVVGTTMEHLEDRVIDIPDIYYAERVANLAERGLIEMLGDPMFMRYSEVRLPIGETVETGFQP